MGTLYAIRFLGREELWIKILAALKIDGKIDEDLEINGEKLCIIGKPKKEIKVRAENGLVFVEYGKKKIACSEWHVLCVLAKLGVISIGAAIAAAYLESYELALEVKRGYEKIKV